jgi:lambda repressor-like predicted transcriptional regulator
MNMNKGLTLALIGILLLTAISVVAISVNAEDKHTVIIGCKNLRPMNRVIRMHGGEIIRINTESKTIVAKVAARQIPRMERHRIINFIEYDKTYTISSQTMPYGVDKIDADQVHPEYTGEGVKVGIMDSGIDYNHPDLDDNYGGGYDFVNDDNDPMDDEGHGTHCAGIVAAEDNSIGTIGVAPDAELYAIKIMDVNGDAYTSDIISGLEWAIDNDIDIVSLSFGADYGSSSLQTALNTAYNNGLVIVAAAGNDGSFFGTDDTIDYPARYTSAIAVGATDSNNIRASWSSTGSTLELMAPGVSIYSTTMSNSYGTKSGTSQATPHVAGVAALMLSKDPSLTNVEIRGILQDTADDLGEAGKDNKYGYGLVDAEESVDTVEGSTPSSMHVHSIDMWFTSQSRKYTVYAKVKVVDDNEGAVEGASVSLELSDPNNKKTYFSGSTDADGFVTFSKGPTRRKGTYTATVTNVVKTDWAYTNGDNLETTENDYVR